ncbi:MAG: hypothetical protein GXP22_06890 [Gammaproteobacteria bacterium]|nr:hypothetical protein [Gammaproteobacteria bacterium]
MKIEVIKSLMGKALLCVLLGSILPAQAVITTDPSNITSSTHAVNISSTKSDITISWDAAISDASGLTYDYVLDQNAILDQAGMTVAVGSENTSVKIGGTLSNGSITADFNAVVDGTFYFHLQAYDSDIPIGTSAILHFGPLILDTAPTLAATPIAPATGSHTSAISVTITGSKFITGATLQLLEDVNNATSHPSVSLTSVNVTGSNTISAVIPANTAPGTYDLSVTNGGVHGQGIVGRAAYISTNVLPVANAGSDQNLSLSSGTVAINLSASASADSDSDPLTYLWTATAALASSGVTVNSTYPVENKTLNVTATGDYTFSLVVNDGFANSSVDTVTYTVTSSTSNNPPVANAGLNDYVDPGDLVALSGSATDIDSTDTLTYSWTMTDKPTGSSASLANATTQTPGFTADLWGVYTISLIVNDGTTDSVVADTVLVTADTPPVPNAALKAGSGVVIDSPVTLTAAGSSDADGDSINFFWTLSAQPVGSSISFTDLARAVEDLVFTPLIAGDYTFYVTANDGIRGSNNPTSSEVTVTIGSVSLDVDGDGDADANDGLMIQRRLTGAGSVASGVVLPTGVGGLGTNGARTDAEVVAVIDGYATGLDVDGDADADANDGLMLQRRLTGAGSVASGVVLPTGVGGLGTSGARTDAEVVAVIDAMKPAVSP